MTFILVTNGTKGNKYNIGEQGAYKVGGKGNKPIYFRGTWEYAHPRF